MNLFIGGTSRENIEYMYLQNSKILVQKLANIENVDLVYGTWNEGLLKVLYQEFSKYHKKITGILTRYHKKMLGDILLADVEIITETTTERFAQIYDHSDILLFLPGGLGTYAEIFSAIEEHRIERRKKIILYNLNGFYDFLLQEFKRLKENNFINEDISDYIVIENDVDKIIQMIKEEIKWKN